MTDPETDLAEALRRAREAWRRRLDPPPDDEATILELELEPDEDD